MPELSRMDVERSKRSTFGRPAQAVGSHTQTPRAQSQRSNYSGQRRVRDPRREVAVIQSRMEELVQQVGNLLAKLQTAEAFIAAKTHTGRHSDFHEAVARQLRAKLREQAGVTVAYLHPNGTEFVLSGPEWTEELSELTASVAMELQEALASSGEPYINGIFVESTERPGTNWAKVYP